ncbi:hypothetical protein A6R68_13325, partial [Neotoma lepida]
MISPLKWSAPAKFPITPSLSVQPDSTVPPGEDVTLVHWSMNTVDTFVLLGKAGSLGGQIVIVGEVLVFPNVCDFFTPQPQTPRITQWKISSGWEWLAWSSYFLGFCCLRRGTARDGPTMQLE